MTIVLSSDMFGDSGYGGRIYFKSHEVDVAFIQLSAQITAADETRSAAQWFQQRIGWDSGQTKRSSIVPSVTKSVVTGNYKE